MKSDVDSLLMNIFFTYAWRMRKLQCECGCGKYLPREINKACMDHTLEKSVYPECKYSVQNIRYYTLDCHTRKGNGFPNEKQEKHIEWALQNYDSLKEESTNFVERIKKKLKWEENELYHKE